MEDLDEHRRALMNLVTASADIASAAKQLERFHAYDLDPLVLLSADHVIHVLEGFLRGELSAEEVGMWAQALEVRDDVDYGNDEAGLIPGTMIHLASEGLGGRPVTPEMARELVSELRRIHT